MAQIQLTDEQLSQAMTVAILGLLTPDMKERVIAEAVAELIKPRERVGGGYRTSYATPLQDAFNRSVEQLAHTVASSYVSEHPEFRARIIEQLDKVASAALAENEGLRQVLVRALASELSEWQRRGE